MFIIKEKRKDSINKINPESQTKTFGVYCFYRDRRKELFALQSLLSKEKIYIPAFLRNRERKKAKTYCSQIISPVKYRAHYYRNINDSCNILYLEYILNITSDVIFPK